MNKSFASSVGHQLREGLLHLQRITYPKSEKRLVMFPWCSMEGSSSSRERAYTLGKNLRKMGWRVIIVPFQLDLEQRQRILDLEKPQILYIQKQRHELNLPKFYDVPRIVFDIDDADFVDSGQKTRVIECCEGSDLVICGSKFVADFCRQYNPNSHIIWTSMALQNQDYPQPSQRSQIVAWGTSDSIGYTDEREFLGEVMLKLRQQIDFEFWVYGVSDFHTLQPFVNGLEKHNIKVKLFPMMSFDKYHQSLDNAAVGLHPIANSSDFSLGKSFGKLNSYMLRGIPIVVQNQLDYPDFFQDGENGMLANEPDEWADKIYQLLVNPLLRDKMANQARIDFQKKLSPQAIANKVNSLLETILN